MKDAPSMDELQRSAEDMLASLGPMWESAGCRAECGCSCELKPGKPPERRWCGKHQSKVGE